MSGTFRPPGTGPNPSRWKSCPWCHADFEADEAICVHCADAYEAGRLAAIRAEVEHYAERLERDARTYARHADLLAARAGAKAADCRRWLEATR